MVLTEVTEPVRDLGDGFHYYVNKETKKRSAGTGSDAAWEGLSPEGLGRDRLVAQADNSWISQAQVVKPDVKSQTVVATTPTDLNGCGLSKTNKVVKVVNVDTSRATMGKIASAEREIHSQDPYATHRFSVRSDAHGDKEEQPNIHLLVGRAAPRSKQTNQRDSFFIDFAHASDGEAGAGREPASFFSVGAPTISVAERNWDDTATSRYTVGALSTNDEDDDDDYIVRITISAPEGEPGIDPFGRRSAALGVQREGRLWNNNRPGLMEDEQRPPDKPRDAPDGRGNPLASSGASVTYERELDSSFKKKSYVEFEHEERQKVTAQFQPILDPCSPNRDC